MLLPVNRREWLLVLAGSVLAAALIFIVTPRYEIIRGNALTFLKIDRWTGRVERCAATCKPAVPAPDAQPPPSAPKGGEQAVSRTDPKASTSPSNGGGLFDDIPLAKNVVEVQSLPGITLRLPLEPRYCQVLPQQSSHERKEFEEFARELRETKNQLLARFVECSYLESLRAGVVTVGGSQKWLHISVTVGDDGQPKYFPGVTRQEAISELAAAIAANQEGRKTLSAYDSYGAYLYLPNVPGVDDVSGSVGMTLIKQFVFSVAEYKVLSNSELITFDQFDITPTVQGMVTMSEKFSDTLLSARPGQGKRSLWEGVVEKGAIGAIVGAIIAAIFGAAHFWRQRTGSK